MTSKTGMRSLAVALVAAGSLCVAAIGGSAQAAPQALSPSDAQNYKAAFRALDNGDAVEAQLHAAQIKDKTLAGHLALRLLLAPGGQRASFAELASWLTQYADLPGAERVFSLAAKRKPAGAAAPKQPLLAGPDWSKIEETARGLFAPKPKADPAAARQAFYAGDLNRALTLAQAANERWIAGMAAYRLKDYRKAESYLSKVGADDDEDPWLRAAASYWASRAAQASGDEMDAQAHLRRAARHDDTFYGMIAERSLTLAQTRPTETAERAGLVRASFADVADLTKFIEANPRAHRATALAQVGQPTEAGLELRAGLALAKTQPERDLWGALIQSLNAPLTSGLDSALTTPRRRATPAADYPAPALEPKWGFTIDKALVYAIVNQESRFNPQARSRAGAVGLMQLMPEAAARAAGDDKLKADMSPLLDPAFNLRVGQDYVTWLMERGVGYDLLRTVAAYNGGPGTLLKTAQSLGPDAESLLIIECLPSSETRNYVEKVVAGYWIYRKKFGHESKTLDALAGGARTVDARLDS